MKCPYCDGSGEITAARASIGAAVRTAREQSGMTQSQLADAVGLSRTQIVNIEANRSRFDIGGVRKFASALGVSVEELIP